MHHVLVTKYTHLHEEYGRRVLESTEASHDMMVAVEFPKQLRLPCHLAREKMGI